MNRQARAVIDFAALQHNFQRVKQLAPSSRIMAVIKADAYGHGMLQVAQALHQADAFAVAQLAEARTLRDAGIDKPLLVFQGFNNLHELEQMAQLDIMPVVHQDWQAGLIEASALSLSIWLKVNTGMGRLGIQPQDVVGIWQRLVAKSSIQLMGLMSHFANADVPTHESNQQQIDCFNQLAEQLGTRTSMANSAGLIAFPEAQGDWVRPGIMLYGASPIAGRSAASLDLRPVMQLGSRLIAINQLKAGECLGYGHLWSCPEDMPVGLVAIGYGDGYPRHATTGTPVSIGGRMVTLLGRVSMDMIAIDLRGVDSVKPGDEVILWGKVPAVDDVAECADTIAYELLCNAGKCRHNHPDSE